MGENSKISWTDDTWNPWEGCQKVGPGCDNCYAETRNARYGGGVAANWGPGAPRRRTSEANWKKPLKWNREAQASGQPRFVFCASLADVFDNAVPVEWRRDLFDLIRATPHLTWLLLTKRPGNIVKLFIDTLEIVPPPGMTGLEVIQEQGLFMWWPRNAAIGCTVVNQDEADRDIPKLLHAKLHLRPAFAFLSMEPLLGQVDLTSIKRIAPGAPPFDALQPPGRLGNYPPLDWVITGGESGVRARDVDTDCFRSLRDQCAAAGVAFHMKQMPRKALIPADLRIQERPGVASQGAK